VLIDVDDRRAVEAERDRAIAMLQVLNDDLEHRVAERTAELLKAKEALRQAQKMEAVGQLTGGLAHDFNNLLAGISGSLQLVTRRLNQGRTADVERYLSAAQGAVQRAAALTHRLLAFSRRQTLDPKPTSVNRLINELEDLIRRTVGPSIELNVIGTTGLWPALVDPSQLENALLNLCINARDAMPNGGRITINKDNIVLDQAAASAHDLPKGEYLLICVSDSGTGIPEDIREKVFEPFFTTKPLGEGTGLGLSMIYGFAKQSGGQVTISSEEGKGTTVCIYLPRHVMDGDVNDEQAK
jgi:signal transduction histidine kinase